MSSLLFEFFIVLLVILFFLIRRNRELIWKLKVVKVIFLERWVFIRVSDLISMFYVLNNKIVFCDNCYFLGCWVDFLVFRRYLENINRRVVLIIFGLFVDRL